ncbi:MAG: endonuclease/exonuclease/phosphatase family protein [Anaerolineales bacterium]|nr:endonuclease/exonuclease/phosphatase family protein [Anaerolineales bacterium]
MLMVSCGPIRNYDDPNEPFYEGYFASGEPVPGEKLKIVTWNLSFAENLEPAIEALTQVDELKNADILLLQEMDEIGVERLAQELGYNYVYYPATVHRRHNKKFGNAVLTKWEIVEHEKILLPKSGSDRKHTRNAVRAVIRIAGQEISAYSVHLETFWVFQSREKRQATFLKNQYKEDENIVVGGDFNSITGGSILYLEQMMEQAGLRRLSKNTGYSFEYKGIKLTLDHIFGSGIEYYESGVWRGSDASDHYPIWSKISLQ